MNMGRTMPVGLLSAALLGGCTTVPRDDGFADVKQLVAERSAMRVHWNQGTAADQAVVEVMRSMLSKELTADDAVQIALLNNLNLQATYEDLGVAQADLVQAGLLRNPVLSIERRFPGQALEIDVAWDFLDLFFIPLRKRVAAAELEAAKLRVGDAVLTTVAETREAFYTLQGSEQMIEMRRSIVDATAASAEVASRMRDAGNITLLELRNEQKLAAQAKLDLARAEAEAVEHRERLNVLMGLWGINTNWRIASRLPELPPGEPPARGLESLAVSQRLDLAAAREQIQAAAQSLGLARAARLVPEANISGHYEREPEGDSSAGPAIEFPLPLFNQGQAAVARGGALLRQAQQRYAALAIEVRSQVRAAHNRMTSARDRADYYRREVLPLSAHVVEQTQLQYNAMQVGVFQLLQAKQAQIDAGREYIETLREYWVARSELERALGGRIKGNEASIPATQPASPETKEPQLHHRHGA